MYNTTITLLVLLAAVPLPALQRCKHRHDTCLGPDIAKGEPLSHSADEPRGREQTRQARDCIPADMDFTLGSDEVQLPQAFIQIEPGINGGQYVCADGPADGLVLMIEGFQPRHASLTNLALPVIEHAVAPSARACGFAALPCVNHPIATITYRAISWACCQKPGASGVQMLTMSATINATA